jgi:hypothetical protein
MRVFGNIVNCKYQPQKILSRYHIFSFACSKTSASVLAIDERQALETLTRDEKTANRSLIQLKEKHQDLDQKREKLSEEVRVQSERKAEVCLECDYWSVGLMLGSWYSWSRR